jgi:dolichyl-phosphate-mannose--protein O-mannosyl transferase
VNRGTRLDAWWQSRMTNPTARRAWSFGAPLLVMLIAVLTRTWNLGHPAALVFDETFYVKDAWTLWNLGYSSSWPEDADTQFNAGQVDSYLTDGSFVVHPPLGKWLIGLGMVLFGADHAWAWRIGTAVAGILGVALLMLVAKRMFRSTLIASIAGFLFAIDGNAIVMSRVGLLDVFVMLFALAAFYFVLLDRHWSAGRLEAWLAVRRRDGRSTDWGPALWWRPWLLAAGLALGLCSAVKWNGLYFLAVFALYTVFSDVIARRRAGIRFSVYGTLLRQAPVTFVLMVPVAAAAYMSTWITWFTTSNGYGRDWAANGGSLPGLLGALPASLQSFLNYESDVYDYHVGESRPHDYQANPLTWLFLIRPTSMYYQASGPAEGCPTDSCGASITGLANPLIWWAATAAVLYLVYRFVRMPDWRTGLILTGMVAGYVPWLQYLHRTVFQFYTIAFEPYMILALTFVLALVLGSPRHRTRRRVIGLALVAGFLVLATALSVFFWPLWTGQQLTYDVLRLHWWFSTWI